MSAPHASAETLSAYLDHELHRGEAREVEDHLAACASCQARLDGLRGVVTDLRHLERLAPPSTLGQLVVRRIELEGDRRSLLDRLETHLGGFERQSSFLGLFALIIALASIILLFAQALEQERRGTTQVIFQDPEPQTDTVILELADRRLRRLGGVWIEEGVTPDSIEETVESETDAHRELVAAHPELAELAVLDAPAIVRLGDLVVRIEKAPRRRGAPPGDDSER